MARMSSDFAAAYQRFVDVEFPALGRSQRTLKGDDVFLFDPAGRPRRLYLDHRLNAAPASSQQIYGQVRLYAEGWNSEALRGLEPLLRSTRYRVGAYHCGWGIAKKVSAIDGAARFDEVVDDVRLACAAAQKLWEFHRQNSAAFPRVE